MSPEEIPQELLDILNTRAKKKHSREHSAVSCLAEILTAYEELRAKGKIKNVS